MRYLFLLAIVSMLFSSCETEIDISADYQQIPVVYGILDLSVDTQIVLINRTFLGSGDANAAAQIEDSMLYNNVEASITWGASQQHTVALQPITLTDKERDGLFFAPTAQAYFVTTQALWLDNGADVPPTNGDDEILTSNHIINIVADGTSITARTKVVSARGNGNGSIVSPSGSANPLNYVSSFNPEGSGYSNNYTINWGGAGPTAVRNALKQEASVRFNYTEHLVGGDTREKSITMPFLSATASSVNSTLGFGETKSSEVFFRTIGNRTEQGADVAWRAMDEVDFIISAAGADLSTLLDIGDPVSDVGQVRPSYSNIEYIDEDGEVAVGIGIFSSRDRYVRTRKLYVDNSPTLQEMVNGQYTSNLCFCDEASPDVSALYRCANEANQCQ